MDKNKKSLKFVKIVCWMIIIAFIVIAVIQFTKAIIPNINSKNQTYTEINSFETLRDINEVYPVNIELPLIMSETSCKFDITDNDKLYIVGNGAEYRVKPINMEDNSLLDRYYTDFLDYDYIKIYKDSSNNYIITLEGETNEVIYIESATDYEYRLKSLSEHSISDLLNAISKNTNSFEIVEEYQLKFGICFVNKVFDTYGFEMQIPVNATFALDDVVTIIFNNKILLIVGKIQPLGEDRFWAEEVKQDIVIRYMKESEDDLIKFIIDSIVEVKAY